MKMKMMSMTRKNDGFTLVELMVVAIIVAVLAAVAIPLMSANKTRAMATEAEAGLGTVRSALRALYAESGAYNADLNGDAIVVGAVAGAVPGIRTGDLDGRFFDDDDYTIVAIAAGTYTIRATGNTGAAPQGAQVAGVIISMNQIGDLTRAGL